MKKTLLTVGITLALAGMLLVPPAITARPNGASSAAAGQRRGEDEGHPEMRDAIRHLEQARAALQKAKREFNGHRSKALELTEQALRECHEALESAR